MPKQDLLNNLNQKKPLETPKPETEKVEIKLEEKKQVQEAKQEEKEHKSEEKTLSTEQNETDTKDWTVESYMKEIKKLRNENKQVRIKHQTELEKLKNDIAEKLTKKEASIEELAQAKKELDDLKAKDADKKRSLEEKLSHREQKIASLETELEALRKSEQEEKVKLQEELDSFRAEKHAQDKVYEEKVQELLKTIPESKKEIATLLVKGSGNSRDAFIALSNAKTERIFDEKEVPVVHKVPSASEGARSTQERLDEANRIERAKKTSGQKIKNALADIKAGKGNSAFRSN